MTDVAVKPEIAALVFVVENYLKREAVQYRKVSSSRSTSVYFEIVGPRYPYKLRVSDHKESFHKEWSRSSDIHVLSMNDLKRAFEFIDTKVVRPMRARRQERLRK